MIKKEAIALISQFPDSNEPWKVNPSVTITRARQILLAGLKSGDPNEHLSHSYEKRVWQLVRNQIRPRF